MKLNILYNPQILSENAIYKEIYSLFGIMFETKHHSHFSKRENRKERLEKLRDLMDMCISHGIDTRRFGRWTEAQGVLMHEIEDYIIEHILNIEPREGETRSSFRLRTQGAIINWLRQHFGRSRSNALDDYRRRLQS